MVTNEWGVLRAVNPGAELRKWRHRRRLSLRALAVRVRFHHSYLGKVERGTARLTEKMAEACDRELRANGALIQARVASEHGTVRPVQLPAAPVELVGRDAEIATLMTGQRERRPGAPGVVAIDGPAGTGKTALALWWAHHVAEEFVDGQLYADLGAFSPPEEAVTAERVLEGFLRAMGATSIPNGTAERAALYRSLLAERRVLIVVDNVADLDELGLLIPASAGCLVVVTSRRTLSSLVARMAATHVTVRPLAEPDAIALVRQVIGDTRADTETLAAVARLCGHLPAALCLAAGQIAMYPHRPVADLVDEMVEDEQPHGTGETRELRDVFSWSYRHLDPEAARLFRLLGLNTGSLLCVGAAAALAGMSVRSTRRLIHQLASLHLVNAGEKIQLDDLVRDYARSLVMTEDDDEQRRAAVERLTTWRATAARQTCATGHSGVPSGT